MVYADLISKPEIDEIYWLGNGKQKSRIKILPACEEKNNGFWHCMTCGEGFRNQLEKSFHIDDGNPHKLAWVCWKHGFEVP